MSDYLDNLVAKSLGLADVVLPRPLSLFEPLPFVSAPFALDCFSLEQDGTQSEVPVSVEPMIDGAASLAPKSELSEKLPAGHREPKSGPALIPHQPAMPAPLPGDAGKRANRSEYAAPAGQQTVDRAVSEHAPSGVVPHATTPAARKSTAAHESTPLMSAHAAAPEHVMTLPESNVPAPPSRTLLIAPVTMPRLASNHVRGSPLSDPAEPILSAPEAERETAPTIKVTIGRVEVRAVMPEPPARRPAPECRNSALSLAEYLKQRSGGKR